MIDGLRGSTATRRLVLGPPAGAAGRHRRVRAAAGELVVPGRVVGHEGVCPRHSERSQRHEYERPGQCCDPAHYGLLRRPPRLLARLLLERSGCLVAELEQHDLARHDHGADQRHARAVDEVGVGRRVEDHRVGAGARREPADVVAAQRPGAAASSPRAAPPRASCACRGPRGRCRTPSRSCSSSPGCSSWRRRRSLRRRSRGARRGTAGGSRSRSPGGTWRRCRSRRAPRRPRRSGRCSGRQRRRPSRRPAARPAPNPSWLPCTRRPSPASRPASSTRRDWSGSNAPSSQNTSIQRASGRQASSISPQTSSTYSSARPSYSGGTAWAPRNVTSSVNSPATAHRRRSDSVSSP